MVIVFIWLMGSVMVWPKVIPLRGGSTVVTDWTFKTQQQKLELAKPSVYFKSNFALICYLLINSMLLWSVAKKVILDSGFWFRKTY